MYVGPKALDVLESVPVAGLPAGTEPDLRKLVDFGWLGLIARPLFLWLKWTYDHIVPNWGWAIVIQTLIINLALLPLRISQMKSMLKMQRVAPQIKAIQEKYKKYSMRDPRKQDDERGDRGPLQDGRRESGRRLPAAAHPDAVPVRVLPHAGGRARSAPGALALGARICRRPIRITFCPSPIVITMLFMQRMTPQAGMDPAQQKMMNSDHAGDAGLHQLEPGRGLVPVLVDGNLIGIVQQSVMNRTAAGPRDARDDGEARAEERQVDVMADGSMSPMA